MCYTINYIDLAVYRGQYVFYVFKENDMKVLVAVKRVVDYQAKVRVKTDGSGVATDGVKMSMNPFDEIAVEEAIRLKEKGLAAEVVLVSIGLDPCQEILRHGLALGADRAILIKTERILEPLNVAKVIQAIIQKENVQLAILGKQAIDNDCNQTGQMLAARLNWPQACFASRLTIQDNHAEVDRETDSGMETIRVSLPAVVTTDLRLNEPRYTSLPNIMKAKQKPLEIIPIDDLTVTLKSHHETLQIVAPPSRQAGILVDSFDELMSKIDREALAI
jgi:electron transfer flavoprotein beta subunit